MRQPCPSCGHPMGGVGWRYTCEGEHDGKPCMDAGHWEGPWGCCDHCSTQQVAEAVQERIARELDHIADSYVELPDGVKSWWDIWEWTAHLAKRVRSGELTKPIEPPF